MVSAARGAVRVSCHPDRFEREYRSRAGDPNPQVGNELRYAQIVGVYSITLGEDHYTLVNAHWYPSAGQHVDPLTQQVKIRRDLQMDLAERIMEASNIMHQVVVMKSPYDAGWLIVLDRRYDSMLDLVVRVDDDGRAAR